MIVEDERIYKENKELSRMFRPAKLKELLEQVRQWKKEGKTKEEVLAIMDRRVLIDSDIDPIYDDNEENINRAELNQEDNLTILRDEDLIDYENQPFSTDNEEDNKILEDSIRLNGIIEPIVVRPYLRKISDFIRS